MSLKRPVHALISVNIGKIVRSRKSVPVTLLTKGNLCGYRYKVSEKFRVAEPLDRHLFEVL